MIDEDGAVERTLADLLLEQGADLWEKTRRLEGLLRDYHPASPLEVSVLMEAVERGVVARLAARQSPPGGAEREVLVAALTEGSGLSVRPATWAVAVWSRTLLGERATERARTSSPPPSRVQDRLGTLAAVLSREQETSV
ncbi:MAG: hypothetical protein AAFV53_06815 [Myxococcota bacterium]